MVVFVFIYFTADILHVPEAKGAQFTALLKSVHILTQTKTVVSFAVADNCL